MAVQTESAPPVAGRPARYRHTGVAVATIVTCQLMLVLDATVVNVALPDIQASLGFTPAGLVWVVNAYLLAFGGLLLLGGRTGDLLGRRRMFTIGIVVFTLASLAGGLAQSPGWLVGTRAIQGVGAALASPGTLALLTSMFSGAARIRVLAVFSTTSAAGTSIGLLLGGVLTEWASWRWVLLVNVPVGVAIVVLAPLFIDEPARHRGRIDVAGALVATSGMVSVVYAFLRAAAAGWRDRVGLTAFGVAIVLLILFLLLEARVEAPLLPGRVVLDRTRGPAYAAVTLLAAAVLSMFYYLLIAFQQVLGYGPLGAGVAFLPMTLALFGVSRLVPRLMARFGPRALGLLGVTLLGVGLAWVSRLGPDTAYPSGLLVPMLLFGVGGGLAFIPLSVTIMSSLAPQDAGAGAGLLQTLQQTGSALGIAILTTAFSLGSRHAAGSRAQVVADGTSAALTGGIAFAAAAFLLYALLPRRR